MHRASQLCESPQHRELQRTAARRAPERRNLLHPEGSPGSHRILAAPLQRHPRTQQPGIPAAGAGNDRSAKLAARLRYAPPAIQLGRETVNALTFNLDQSVGADHERRLNSDNVLHCLTEFFVQHGPPDHIRSDNGSEITAHAVRDWLGRIGVQDPLYRARVTLGERIQRELQLKAPG